MRKDINITVMGGAKVGKTEFVKALLRFVDGKHAFNSAYAPTLGASYFTCQLPRVILQLKIWDTAGQELYCSLLPMYLLHPDFVFLVIDSQASKDGLFEEMQKFYDMVTKSHQRHDFSSVMIMLSKTDLPDQTITARQVREFCSANGMPILDVIEISSKKMTGIDKVVQMMHDALKDCTALLKACAEQMKITLQDYASARVRGRGASIAMFLKHPNRHWTTQIQAVVDRINDGDLNTPQKIYEALEQSTSKRKTEGALEHIIQHFISEYNLEVVSHDEGSEGIPLMARAN